MRIEYPKPTGDGYGEKYDPLASAERIARSLQAHGKQAGDSVFVRICQKYNLSRAQETELSKMAVTRHQEIVAELEREFSQAPTMVG